MHFSQVDLFNRFLSNLPYIFYSLTKFKVVFEIQGVKAGEFNRFFMEGTNWKRENKLLH